MFHLKPEKSIIIGCDRPSVSSRLSSILHNHPSYKITFVVANRISDLLKICETLSHDILILSFQNNQLALNDYAQFVRTTHKPILCIDEWQRNDSLRWNNPEIVFTCNITTIDDDGTFDARLSSIIQLKDMKSACTGSQYKGESSKSSHDQNLSRYIMELDQKTNLLEKVKEKIKLLYPSANDSLRDELISIVNSIKLNVNNQNLWDDFKLYFEEADPHFLAVLAQKHPELTTLDLKYCCYLKMNMGNDAIKGLLGINQESVRTHKYRLKKKMSLKKEEDLLSYLRQFDYYARGVV